MKQEKRDNKGRFVKGVSGNPGGGPKGRRTALVEIEQAIEEFKKDHGISYWKAATILAMKLAKEDGNTHLLSKIMDKFIPSKIESDLPLQSVTIKIEKADADHLSVTRESIIGVQ